MQTNFFQSITALQVAGDWKINIASEKNGTLVVSVLYYNEAIGDDAAKMLPPMLLKGTPAQLDEGFFATIQQPVQETAQLFTNMEQYLKQREQAKLQSQMQKDIDAKAEKDQSEKDKKYQAAMKLVDELEQKGKYRDAWVKVPDHAQHPEHEQAIRARKTALAKKFAPDMFDTPQPVQQDSADSTGDNDKNETAIDEPQNTELC